MSAKNLLSFGVRSFVLLFAALLAAPGNLLAQTPLNLPPQCKIIRPLKGAVFAAGTDIDIHAEASDPDGRVVTVEFFAGDRSLGVVTGASLNTDRLFRLVWADAPAGRFVLTARATDDDGAFAVSAAVNVTIHESLLPVVGIKAIDPFAREPNFPDPLAFVVPDTAALLVTRSRGTNDPLIVHYSVTGSASNGVDYKKLNGEVVIPAGELSVKLEVEALPDNADETTETVIVKLDELGCIAIFPPSPDCYAVNPAMSSAAAYILDRERPNEPPKVSMVSPPDGAVIPGPTDIRLVAAAADVDGWVKSVEFFEGTNSLGIVHNPPIVVDPNRALGLVDFEMEFRRPIYPFQLTWSNVPPGNYVLTAVATDNDGASTKSDPVEIKVIELPQQPIVTVVASDPHASEPDPTTDQLDTATFVVRRSGGDLGIPLTVHYSLDGSAKNGVDYKELLLSVVIPAGERSARIVVEPIDDTLVEGTEKVLITIQPSACVEIFPPPPDCYLVGRPRHAVAYICDNDLPNRPPVARLVHPVDGQVFRAGADIILAAAAWDYNGSIKQVEFFEGTNSLGVATNPWPDPDLPTRLLLPLYRLVWSNVPPGHFVLTAVATDNAGESGVSEPVEIKVVEPKPPVTVTVEATDPEAEETSPLLDRPTNPAVFTVKREGGTNMSLTVYYRLGGTAENGVDYAKLPEKVTIPEGSWSAELVIDPIDDSKVEGTETVWIRLVPSLCVNLFPPRWDCYRVGNPGEARAIILDDDQAPANLPPIVRLLLPIDEEVFAAPADITLLASARDPDGTIKGVEFFNGDNSLGVVTEPVPGSEQLYRLVWRDVHAGAYTLFAVATDDDGETAKSNSADIRVIERPRPLIVTITAPDPLGTEQSPLVDALPDNGLFRVHRNTGTNESLKVKYALEGTARNGIDYKELSSEVTIPAGSYSADLPVEVIDDNLLEGTEWVKASLKPNCFPGTLDPTGPIPVAGCYVIGFPNEATVFIRDNESQPNLPPQVRILKPHNGDAFESGANIEIAAEAIDLDGWVPTMEFFANNRKIGEQTIYFIVEPPPGQRQEFSLTWSNVPPGQYVLTTRATDNLGATSWSAPVLITVGPSHEVPVVNVIATDAFAAEQSEPFGPNTATFRLRRTGPTNDALIVFIGLSGTASNAADYLEIGNTVAIPAGRRTARVVVTPVDDSIPEYIETVILELQPDPSLAPIERYRVGWPPAAGAIVVDNDRDRPSSRCLRDGVFHLCLPADNGLRYRLDVSDDLIHWLPVCENEVTDGAIHFVDPESQRVGRRFFRAVQVELLAGEEE